MSHLVAKMLIIILALNLAACSTNTPRQNQGIGAVAGAGAGIALAANSGPSPGAITVLGTAAIVGALIGSSYGNYMENSDKERAFKAIAEGKPASWQNPATKVSFKVIPTPNYVTFDGNTCCRQFTATQTTTDGGTRKIFRTACKSKHDAWELVH